MQQLVADNQFLNSQIEGANHVLNFVPQRVPLSSHEILLPLLSEKAPRFDLWNQCDPLFDHILQFQMGKPINERTTLGTVQQLHGRIIASGISRQLFKGEMEKIVVGGGFDCATVEARKFVHACGGHQIRFATGIPPPVADRQILAHHDHRRALPRQSKAKATDGSCASRKIQQ